MSLWCSCDVLLFEDSLLECLKNKMKKERQPLVSVEEIASVRAKYSHKGSGRKRHIDLQDDSSPVLARRVHEVRLHSMLFTVNRIGNKTAVDANKLKQE